MTTRMQTNSHNGSQNTPVIEVTDLKVRYGDSPALNGISFDVYQNEILGIIGPAQSGKTTLLKVINRTLEFTPDTTVEGSVKLDGVDINTIGDVYGLRRRIGMVLPLPVGLPLSIYDNVAFAPRTAGIRAKSELDEIVERCLQQAALWDEVKDRLNHSAPNYQVDNNNV